MKAYSFFAVLSVSTIILVMAFVQKEGSHPDKHLEIVLRNIGHELLLRSNDSTSRVLPIQAVNDHSFRITFENEFRFTPDTLMYLVHEQLAKTDRPADYTVSVNDCRQNRTVFAYEVNSSKGDLKPCRGRAMEKACYVIEISFAGTRSFNYAWLLLALVPVLLAGLYAIRRKTPEPAKTQTDELPSGSVESIPVHREHKHLGKFIFIESKEVLELNGETISLSEKEAKALSILVSQPDQVVGRDLLMKEIWENAGVFVIPRNVDVLISKLRKKLSGDPEVRIVNVQGKGYKIVF